MTYYRVSFFKHLVNSTGQRFRTLQRVVEVQHSPSEHDAVRTAQARFAELEHIPDWRLHADVIETEIYEIRA